ncbi:hypothetical protein, partial [Cohnella terricola]|uniref:hypothetical protein n=1 Tax=Cohnella terricola TaxID=1289167 RepID=UPI001C975CF0
KVNQNFNIPLWSTKTIQRAALSGCFFATFAAKCVKFVRFIAQATLVLVGLKPFCTIYRTKSGRVGSSPFLCVYSL